MLTGGLPGRVVATSEGLGWRSVDARTYADPAETEAFTTRSDRLLVVLVTSGRYRIESYSGGSWRRAAYRPGSIGVTAPDNPAVLRWQSTSPAAMESLHLHLDPGVVAGTSFPDSLAVHDEYVTAATRTLGEALIHRAPSLYADSLAQALVVHLAMRATPAQHQAVRQLGRIEVDRVVELMRARLGDDVTLDELAAAVNVSKFHFIRAFTQATGLTPYRYLRRLRMQAAQELLRTSTLGIARIALLCGYRSPGRFAAAFRAEHGVSPSDLRNPRR
jgi:AraC family transcriptional regulator